MYQFIIEITTSLWEITCHMGSHSITYHPAAVTFPTLPQPKLVLDLATLEGCKAELTWITYNMLDERWAVKLCHEIIAVYLTVIY